MKISHTVYAGSPPKARPVGTITARSARAGLGLHREMNVSAHEGGSVYSDLVVYIWFITGMRTSLYDLGDLDSEKNSS